jgi:Subtilase family
MKKIVFRLKDNYYIDFFKIPNNAFELPQNYQDALGQYCKLFGLKKTKANVEESLIRFISEGMLNYHGDEFKMKIRWLYHKFDAKNLITLYTSISDNILNKSITPPNFFNVFYIYVNENLEGKLLSILNKWDCIFYAYSVSTEVSANPSYTHPLYRNEYTSIEDRTGYRPIYSGLGVRLVVLDKGFLQFHPEDALTAPSPYTYNLSNNVIGNNEQPQHGTKALGILIAKLTAFNDQVEGLVPDTDIALVSSMWNNDMGNSEQDFYTGLWYSIANCLYDGFYLGNVILIEQQYEGDLPLEIDRELALIIWFATHFMGIIVIEPSGNSDNNLDKYEDIPPYLLESNYLRNTGAIMVGAVNSNPSERFNSNNNKIRSNTVYGTRIDCYAWGSDVISTTTNSDGNFSGFNSTSLSSSIVAGIAVSLQSNFISRIGRRLLPWEMRWLLYNNFDSTGRQIVYNDSEFLRDNFTFEMLNLETLINEKINQYLNGNFQQSLFISAPTLSLI